MSKVDNDIIGDILELNAFNSIGAKLDGDTVLIDKHDIQIVKRFYFNSTIKKMSVIVKIGGRYWLTSKGAPESIGQLLK